MKQYWKLTWALALLACVALAPVAAAQQAEAEPKLEVGDDAPELEITDWLKGKAVKIQEGEGDTVYVVEFWATWCPPCRTSIPHLTELQKKYKDRGVVIIGVTMESAEKVKPWVEEMGDQMDYTVAVDGERKTSKAYMIAAGEAGIPHAFVIDKEGKLAWHGHPMDKAFEAKLEELAPPKTEEAPAE